MRDKTVDHEPTDEDKISIVEGLVVPVKERFMVNGSGYLTMTFNGGNATMDDGTEYTFSSCVSGTSLEVSTLDNKRSFTLNIEDLIQAIHDHIKKEDLNA